MQRTAHYNLPIFEANDKPSILVDFNQAMQTIDESMFLIATGGDSSIADAIAALEAGLLSVTSQIAVINQTLGTKLDTSFMNNLAAEFDSTTTYFKYDFVFADGNLYQCIEDYDPQTSSFDVCFRPVWLCNSVAKAEADLEELSDDYDALEARVTTLENAPGYELPIADASHLGGVKVGSGLTISASGVLDAVPGSISPATASELGGVKIGSGVNVTSDGTISVPTPTPYTLPTADANTLGGIKKGGGIAIDSNGVLTPDLGLGLSVYDGKLTISANSATKTVDFYSANGVTTSTKVKYRMYTRFIPAMRTSTGGIGSNPYVLDAIGTVYSTDSIAYELKNGFVINTTFFDNTLSYEHYMGTAELYDTNNQQSLSYRIIPSRKNGGRAEFIPITDAKSGSVTALTTDTLGDTGKLRLAVHIIRGTRDYY